MMLAIQLDIFHHTSTRCVILTATDRGQGDDAFQKISKHSRMESVKLLQYFFSCLDIKLIYIDGNSCHQVLLRVNISVVYLVFIISCTTILSIFKKMLRFIDRCPQTVRLCVLFTPPPKKKMSPIFSLPRGTPRAQVL